MAEKEDIYRLSCLPREATKGEIEALQSMFSHAGWSVFMQMRKIQANESTDTGMSLVASETDRTKHRASYYGCQDNLNFEKDLTSEFEGAEPLTEDEVADIVENDLDS